VYPPHLRPVPDVADPGYTPDPDVPVFTGDAVAAAVEDGRLLAGDVDYIPGARQYMDTADSPSARGLKAALSVGQDKAKRLYLFVKGETP
jgi:hypothetical protein